MSEKLPHQFRARMSKNKKIRPDMGRKQKAGL
jgi:hypothetical protein